MINGNIKILELSKALLKDGASCVASSGTASQNNMLDFSKITRTQSVGSDDTTVETYTITFQEAATISRLLFLNFNWKAYTITPIVSSSILDNDAEEILDNIGDAIEDDGSTLEFLEVISSTNSTKTTGISETAHDSSNQYYEFKAFYCTGLTISVTSAQMAEAVPDQEKFCYICFPTIEIDSDRGTFEQYPVLQSATDFLSINTSNLAGKNKIQKLDPVFSAVLTQAVTGVQNDIRIMEFIRNADTDFVIFPMGGKLLTAHFRFQSSPYDWDVYQVQVSEYVMAQYINNITANAMSQSVGLSETI